MGDTKKLTDFINFQIAYMKSNNKNRYRYFSPGSQIWFFIFVGTDANLIVLSRLDDGLFQNYGIIDNENISVIVEGLQIEKQFECVMRADRAIDFNSISDLEFNNFINSFTQKH